MTDIDKIHRFIFDEYGIRGEFVKLTSSCKSMIENHQYPPLIATLLQQVAAVNVLLATTLKFEGRISIQLQTVGHLKMLVVQTSHDLEFRGVAQYDKNIDYSTMCFTDLAKNGQMCITIEPKKGERYQGIVSLDGDTLADCVIGYFNQSEQLKTKLWLYSDHSKVCGLMLQALPDMDSDGSFQHLSYLAETLSKEECFSVDSETLLHRLFHQESINNLAVDEVTFKCACSRDKMLNSLVLLGQQEIEQILKEQSEIEMTCEFCLTHFSFNELDIKKQQSLDGNVTQH